SRQYWYRHYRLSSELDSIRDTACVRDRHKPHDNRLKYSRRQGYLASGLNSISLRQAGLFRRYRAMQRVLHARVYRYSAASLGRGLGEAFYEGGLTRRVSCGPTLRSATRNRRSVVRGPAISGSPANREPTAALGLTARRTCERVRGGCRVC